MDVPREIASSEAITELDFRQSGHEPFTYFYEVVMGGFQWKKDGVISTRHTLSPSTLRFAHMSVARQGLFMVTYRSLDVLSSTTSCLISRRSLARLGSTLI